jgi:hypothetical protein
LGGYRRRYRWQPSSLKSWRSPAVNGNRLSKAPAAAADLPTALMTMRARILLRLTWCKSPL